MRHTIQGNVVQAEDNRGLPGVEVDIYEYQSNADRSGSHSNQRQLLASLVTDPSGVFSMEWDDIEVLHSDPGSRQVGMPAIVAEVYVSSSRPRSRGVQERKLLASTSPRQMARMIDSFIIRVTKREVIKAGIKLPKLTTSRPRRVAQTIEAEIKQRLDQRTKHIKAIRKGTKTVLKNRIRVKRKGNDFAKGILTNAAVSRRGHSKLFVPQGTDSDKVLDKAMADGLTKLAKRKASGVRIHKGDHLSKEIEAALDKAAKTGSKLSNDIVEKILTSCRTGFKSIRVNDTLTEFRSSIEASEIADSLNNSTEEAESSSEQGVGEFTEEYKAALAQVLKLIKARTDISIGLRPDMGTITENLGKEVPQGPADTTAYYDFHSLEIAWEDSWTAAIDSLTADEIAELYESIVEILDPEVVKEIGIKTTGPQVFQKLNLASPVEYLAPVQQAINAAKTTPGYQVPTALVGWLPRVDEVWDSLPPDDQDTISAMHRFYDYVDGLKKGEMVVPLSIELGGAFAFALLGNAAGAIALISREIGELFDDYSIGRKYIPGFELCLIANVFEMKIAAKRWALKEAKNIIKRYFKKEGTKNDTGGEISSGIEVDALPPGLGRAGKLLEGIKQRLAEPYKFDIFVPGSYNYGVFFTFRQRWEPLTYQVGKLVSSMPLAPGETRSYTKKQVIKTSRSQKELEKAVSSLKNDSTTTGRTEAEIIKKANSKMDFSTSTEGGFNAELYKFSGKAAVGGERGSDSATTKNNFREAVRAAAQEFTNERSLEVTTEREVTGELIETGEISNPNNELTVTYLFYELQRRFNVSEKIHELTPVIMVAYDVPKPHEIDEDWLLTYAWILKRVILDDSFLKGLKYISETFTGDEVGVDVLYKQWAAQMEIVASIADNVSTLTSFRDQARASLLGATEQVAGKDGILLDIHKALHGDGASEKDLIEARTESAELGLDWANSDFNSASARLQSASQALRQATDDYIGALKKQLNRRTAIDQVRIHVKDNILHYMQAIWRHEHRDQRYFRLYDLEIKWPEAKAKTSTVSAITTTTPAAVNPFNVDPAYRVELPKVEMTESRKLHEVADLDKLIGFRGNYAIFPLSESNALTNSMSQDFFDNYFGVVDQGPLDHFPTRSEALAYVQGEWNKSGTDKLALTQWLVEVLSAQKRISEEIIVPTGQLFIEALPGSTPLLEDFKLKHRAVDVRAAEVDLDLKLIEALRHTARLSQDDLSDPDVDKNIRIDGDSKNVIVDAE